MEESKLYLAKIDNNTIYLATYKEIIKDSIIPIKSIKVNTDRIGSIIDKYWCKKPDKWEEGKQLIRKIVENEGK